MADSNITKRALASAMKKLMGEFPFEKINVATICEKCDMNRKSFYYHFRDKYDLVNWIFDTEFIGMLEEYSYCFDWESIQDYCEYFYTNQNFYRNALKIKGQNCFCDHLHATLLPIFHRQLEQSLETELEPEFYLSLYTDMCIGAFKSWLSEKNCLPPQIFVEQLRKLMQVISFTNIEHSSFYHFNFN